MVMNLLVNKIFPHYYYFCFKLHLQGEITGLEVVYNSSGFDIYYMYY